jgi:dTDP-glucose 4,6-dehydratase
VLICVAGATSVDAALSDPKTALEENIAIAIDIAEWSRNINPNTKIIYMSSDEVLGASIEPLFENAPLNPSQPYAVSKASAEMILHNYRDIYHLNIVTLRSCNLVGIGQMKPKLIPTVVHCLRNNKPVPIHGNGNQLREWMDVSDLCHAIVLLVTQDITPQIYQATSGIKISVNDVVNHIAEKLNIEFQVKHTIDRLVQDSSYSMRTDRLNLLGWFPVIDAYDSIKNTAQYLFSNSSELNALQ